MGKTQATFSLGFIHKDIAASRFFVIPDKFIYFPLEGFNASLWNINRECSKVEEELRQDGHFECTNPS